MIHMMNGDWRIHHQDLYIDCGELYSYIRMKNFEPDEIDMNLIAHKELDSISTSDIRFLNANPNLPGILAKDMINPQTKKYRLLDGRHRLKKSVLNGNTKFKAYVISQEEALRFAKAFY